MVLGVIGGMKERGRVVETRGNMAKVEVLRRDECSRCKVCGFGSRDRIVAMAVNTLGAETNDEVELELEGTQVVKAAAILYLIPLVFLVAGLYAGTVVASFIDRQDIATFLAAVFGFGLLGLSYIGLAIYSKRPSIAKYQARITEILTSDSGEGRRG